MHRDLLIARWWCLCADLQSELSCLRSHFNDKTNSGAVIAQMSQLCFDDRLVQHYCAAPVMAQTKASSALNGTLCLVYKELIWVYLQYLFHLCLHNHSLDRFISLLPFTFFPLTEGSLKIRFFFYLNIEILG